MVSLNDSLLWGQLWDQSKEKTSAITQMRGSDGLNKVDGGRKLVHEM